MSEKPVYKRVLLKLSGEALSGENAFGVDPNCLDRICVNVQSLVQLGVEVALVIGGGNLFRGFLCCFAHRPLPSMMMATCRGMGDFVSCQMPCIQLPQIIN